MRAAIAVLLILVSSVVTFAQANEFKVRYNGGTIESKVKPDDWKNTIAVTSETITLKLKDGTEVKIDPQKVTRLSYGKNASRNIKGYAIAAIIINPLFALGMLKKNKQHFVGIEFEGADGKKAAVLLQAKNDKYRSLIIALQAVTGKTIETEEKEKK